MKHKPLKNKRGAILATAVMFMTVLSFLGILLTSILLYSHTIVRTNDKIFKTRLTLDQIGEYFVAGQEIPANLVDESYKLETNNDILTLKNSNGTIILYIEKDGTTAKIWRYSAPENE